MLGPPGAGKGTLAGLLKESLNLLHISTGDILREEMKNNTELGQQAKQFIENGELVPDKVVIMLIEKKLSAHVSSKKGYMLDGFPRTCAQAQALDQILEKLNQPIDMALYLESTLPVIVKRLIGRRVCKNCGALYHVDNKPPKMPGICDECSGELYQRADDNEETINTRMGVYLENTMPIIDYYKQQDKLKKLDADQDSRDLQSDLMEIIDEGKEYNKH